MILKLIKHELKAVLPSLTSVFIALFSLAVVGPILLNFNAEWLSVIVVLAGVSAMIAVSIVTIMVIVNVMNKRTFSSLGYLNLTLPVSSTQLLLSKVFVAMIISTITGIMTFLAVVVFAFSASWMLFNGLEPLRYAMEVLSDIGIFSLLGKVFVPLSLVAITKSVYYLCLLLLVVTFVHTSFVRKNKMLVAVVSYLAISILLSVFVSNMLGAEYFTIVNNLDSVGFIPGDELSVIGNVIRAMEFKIDWAVIGMTSAFYLVMSGVFFTLSQYFVDRKLEVE